MNRLFAALLLAVAVQASVASARRLGVSGGGAALAMPGQFPYQAWVESVSANGTTKCSGALISAEWVLTAASCVTYPGLSVNVKLGSFDVSLPSEDSRIQYNFVDKKLWSAQLVLLHLPQSAWIKPLNDYVTPIRLPPKSYAKKSLNFWKSTVSGYGQSKPDDKDGSWILRSFDARVEPNFLCKFQLGRESFQSNSNLCLFSLFTKNGICEGDVGNPLVVTESDGQPTLLGIATGGAASSCNNHKPALFVKITPYLDWISATTGVALRD